MVELVYGLLHGRSGGDQGKFLSGRAIHFRSSKVVKPVHGPHQESPKVVKLVMGFHQGCFIREQEMSWGGKASDGASPHKLQGGGVHDKLHHGSS